jgi:hypothetical protein
LLAVVVGMKVYLAGEWKVSEYGKLTTAGVRRRLISYFYHQNIDDDVKMSAEMGLDLFLDSGAFTAFTKKVKIDAKRYTKFIQDCKGIWSCCSSIDHIGRGNEAAQKSYDNLKELESLGASVCPVFHVREPEAWLTRYIDEGYPYIFIGGMVPETTGWLRERLDGLWGEYLCNPDGTARVKVHGFGLTDSQLMFRYPWYSVDSSSWLMTGIYGSCMLETPGGMKKIVFSEESPEARKMKGWHFKTLSPGMQDQVREWVQPYGVTVEQLMSDTDLAAYRYRNVVNAASFQALEKNGVDRFIGRQDTLFALGGE